MSISALKVSYRSSLTGLLLILSLCAFSVWSSSAYAKPRVIIFSDIGKDSVLEDNDPGDPDDNQSMVRLLLHSNELDILGFVSSLSFSSRLYDTGMFDESIDAFEADRPNLQAHAALLPAPYDTYPTASALRAVVKEGDDPNTRIYVYNQIRASTEPIWLLAWGGLKEIQEALDYAKTQSDYDQIIGRVHIYAIGQQDDSNIWGTPYPDIQVDHPDIGLSIRSRGQFAAISDSNLHMNWVGTVPSSIADLFSDSWVDTNVQNGHGNLGNVYPDAAFIYEGDSPSFMHVLPIGLTLPGRPDWGSWGGRMWRLKDSTSTPGFWEANKNDNWKPEDTYMGVTSMYVPVWRWRTAYQNEFEARMDWARTGNVNDANHPPRITSAAAGARSVGSNEIYEGEVGQGDTLSLSASATDPDSDSLSYHWFIYSEADRDSNSGNWTGDHYTGATTITNANSANASFAVPASGHLGQNIHVVLEVTDNGSPVLTRYARLVLTIVESVVTQPESDAGSAHWSTYSEALTCPTVDLKISLVDSSR